MKKILSFLLSFCILVAQFGCSTFKTIPQQEASITATQKHYLILHAPGNRYQLSHYRFTDAGLEGHLEPFEGGNLNTFHVFTDMRFSHPGSSVKVPVVIPNSHIQKVKYARHSTLKTILFVGGFIALVTFVGMKNMRFNYLSY